MALTPEDVLNQKFTITKFRDGYDLDQVDEFLDTIVEEIRAHEAEAAQLREKLSAAMAENEALKAQLAEAGNSGAPASEQTIVMEAPQPVSEAQPSVNSNEADANKSSAMLQLALELHDKHVHEGEAKRDQLISEAEHKAKTMVSDAESQRKRILKELDTESYEIRNNIKELREYETEYRTTLRSYIQSQLRNLDGSPEPDRAPAGLD